MTMKFYMTPGSCSTGIHILLEECGLVFEAYVVNHFTIADAALFYVEFRADRIGIPLPENCAAHYRRMLTRSAVRQVLAEEGYASVLR